MKKLLTIAAVFAALQLSAQHAGAQTGGASTAQPPPPANTASGAQANGNSQVAAQSALQKEPLNFLALAAGVQSVSYSGDNTKGGILYGATLSGGGFLPSKNPFLKNIILSADAGVYFGSWNDTLRDVTEDYTPPGGNPGWDLDARTKVKRKSDSFSVPVLLNAAYNFRLGEDFDFRIGPSLGFTFVSMKSKFDGRTDLYRHADGTTVPGNPLWTDSYDKSASKALFSYGATLGASWRATRNFSVDLQYRIQGNTKLDVGVERNYGTSLIHQFNVGAIWRF